MILFSCKPEAEKPTVTTKSVGEVTETTAKVVGQVTADGGAEVTERGVCWNTAPAPEVIDYRTKDAEGGLGTYELDVTNLKDNTQYYVRAYATNEKGVSYGEELTFTTKKEIELPEVKTAEVEDITESEAVSGGEVVSDGGAEVTARGICWSTKQNPTIEDDKTTDGSGVGTFASEMTDLEADTKYYVRAYATNEKGTAYGEEVSFTTEEVEEPEEPEDPETPEQPEDPETPEQPEDPETPEQPEDPENPEQPEDPENPEQPEGPENPEQPENPENPEQPEDPGTPEQPENPENPEQPEDPETPIEPEQPEDPENPEQPEQPEQPVGPVVITAEVTEITINTAVCGGEVVSGGDAVVIARGICYNTTGAPTVSDTYTMDGNGMGVYTSYMTDLQLGTTYYVRAYATDVKGITSYGEEVTFTTLEKLLPTVVTGEVTEIKFFSATCGGEVTFNGNVSVTARGICWSTSPNPTIEDNKTNNGSGVGSYTYNMTNLEHNTTYYVRAYAINEVGTAYGEERTFTTLSVYSPATGTSNGYGYVDLGLSVKWATCNVGATSLEEYGNYFAWGETSTKINYFTSNCPTYGLSTSELQSQGYIDNEGNLTAQYDAATANWGGTWRMPTYDELNELNTQCTWEWINTNDFKGYKVTGPNGNSIFLPAAGCRDGSSLKYAGGDGCYWSSAPIEGSGYNAYGLNFGSSGHIMYYYYRGYGRSVRPILE